MRGASQPESAGGALSPLPEAPHQAQRVVMNNLRVGPSAVSPKDAPTLASRRRSSVKSLHISSEKPRRAAPRSLDGRRGSIMVDVVKAKDAGRSREAPAKMNRGSSRSPSNVVWSPSLSQRRGGAKSPGSARAARSPGGSVQSPRGRGSTPRAGSRRKSPRGTGMTMKKAARLVIKKNASIAAIGADFLPDAERSRHNRDPGKRRAKTAPSGGGGSRVVGKSTDDVPSMPVPGERTVRENNVPAWLAGRPDYRATMFSHSTLTAAVLRHAHSRVGYEMTTIGDWLREHVHLERFMSVGMSGNFMNEFTKQLRGRRVLKGEVIFYESDTVLNDFYIILNGWFEVVVDQKVVAMLGSGDTFGHLALIRHKSSLHKHATNTSQDMARSASVVAGCNGVLMELNAVAFDELMRAFNTRFRSTTVAYLQNHSKFFQRWNRARLYRAVGHIKEVSFKKGDIIMEEGQPAQDLLFVRRGKVRLAHSFSEAKVWRVPMSKDTWHLHEETKQRSLKICDLGDGEAFGTAASLAHRYQGTIRYLDYAKNAIALTDCTVLKLPASHVAESFPLSSQRLLRERFIEVRDAVAQKEAVARSEDTRRKLIQYEAVSMRGPRYTERIHDVTTTKKRNKELGIMPELSILGKLEVAVKPAFMAGGTFREEEAAAAAAAATEAANLARSGSRSGSRPLSANAASSTARSLSPSASSARPSSSAVTAASPQRASPPAKIGSHTSKTRQLLKVRKFKTEWGKGGNHISRAEHEMDGASSHDVKNVSSEVRRRRAAQKAADAALEQKRNSESNEREFPAWLVEIQHELKMKAAAEAAAKAKQKVVYSPECVAASQRLHEAAKKNSVEECRAVLQEGICDVNWANETRATALIHAIWGGPLELIELLVMNGANVNHQTSKGFSALHFAYERGKKTAATFLVQSGARFLKTVSGKTPHDLAPPGFTAMSDTKTSRTGFGGISALPEFVTNEIVTYRSGKKKLTAVVRAVDIAGEAYDNQYTIVIVSTNELAVVRFDQILKKPNMRSRIRNSITLESIDNLHRTFRMLKSTHDTPEHLLQTLIKNDVSCTLREATVMAVGFPRRFNAKNRVEERKILAQALSRMHQARPGWKKQMQLQNKSRRHSMADLQNVLKKHSGAKTPVKRMAPIRALSSPTAAKREEVTKSAGSAHQSEMMTSMLRLVAKNQKMAEFRKTHHARAVARTRRKDLAALGMDVQSSKEVTKNVGETATRAVITVLTKRLSRLRTAEVTPLSKTAANDHVRLLTGADLGGPARKQAKMAPKKVTKTLMTRAEKKAAVLAQAEGQAAPSTSTTAKTAAPVAFGEVKIGTVVQDAASPWAKAAGPSAIGGAVGWGPMLKITDSDARHGRRGSETLWAKDGADSQVPLSPSVQNSPATSPKPPGCFSRAKMPRAKTAGAGKKNRARTMSMVERM